MRVTILGAGAIGSAVGALLARAGQEVVLVGREDHVARIRRDGLTVDGCLGSFTVHMPADTRLEDHPELTLLTVKSQDLDGILETYRDALMGTPIVTMQNGIRSEGIARTRLPDSPVVGCVVTMTANYLEPGHVTLVQRGDLVVGRSPDGPPTALVREVARILGQAVPTTITDNLSGVRWTKVLVNLNNAVPAMVNEPLDQIAEDPYLIRLALGLMREGVRTVRRAGIRLADLPGFRLRTLRLVTALPVGMAARSYTRRVRSLGAGEPVLGSTLQSLRRGRRTEIDFLNGEVVALGREIGEPTPLNAKVVELVHQVEATGAFLSSPDLRHALTEPNG